MTSTYDSPLIIQPSSSTAHHSPLTIRLSPLASHHSPLTTHQVPGSTAISACVDCSPGTMAGSAGSATCTRCAPGTYQGASGATECSAACEPGSFCAEGAGAPLPCSGGTDASATDLSNAAQCQTTDPGFYAPTGSTVQTPCSPGTVAPSASMSSCVKCGAGKYQAIAGKQTCDACPRWPGTCRLHT